jgi:hypothetical protein
MVTTRLIIDAINAFDGTQSTPVDFLNSEAMDENPVHEQPSQESSKDPQVINVDDVINQCG